MTDEELREVAEEMARIRALQDEASTRIRRLELRLGAPHEPDPLLAGLRQLADDIERATARVRELHALRDR